MNFYQAQDQARKQSRLLVALFVLAVSVLVLITNICVALFVLYSNPSYSLSAEVDPVFASHSVLEWLQQLVVALGWQKGLWTTSLVCGFIFMAMGFKWSSLRQGGKVIAESLGGTLVQSSSRDVAEKRLLNIIEEIALASGTPVPPVYLLQHELGINAFAAGLSAEDAVIGITHGALNHFNREQLQGVIAHEFSHILNGDMRLNMKLVAVLHGILMISESGRFLLRLGGGHRRFSSRRRDNKAGGLFIILGLCLWLIGLLGQLFGALIKAAVSRQREFLADASAVQFTRNPEGIAQALSIIGGVSYQSKLEHHGAHELGHLFFSDARALAQSSAFFKPSSWQFFATHPPLSDRIKRIQPTWSGKFLKQKIIEPKASVYASPDPAYPSFTEMQGAASDTQGASMNAGISGLVAGTNADVGNTMQQTIEPVHDNEGYQYVEFEPVVIEPIVSTSTVSNLSPPGALLDAQVHAQADNQANLEGLLQLAHQPYDASLMVVALLISQDPIFKAQQLELINQTYAGDEEKTNDSIALLCDQLDKLNAKQTLELIEVALPSLKSMSLKQYQVKKTLLTKLIQVDRKVDVFEWLIFQLIKQNLDRHFALSRPSKPRYKSLGAVKDLFEIVLSRVVHYGFEDIPADEIDQQDKQLVFNRACDVSGIKAMSLLNLEECDGKSFSQAVHKLSLSYPLLKPRLIKGLLAAIHFDEQVTDKERYVITAIAAVMDCPLIGLDIDAT